MSISVFVLIFCCCSFSYLIGQFENQNKLVLFALIGEFIKKRKEIDIFSCFLGGSETKKCCQPVSNKCGRGVFALSFVPYSQRKLPLNLENSLLMINLLCSFLALKLQMLNLLKQNVTFFIIRFFKRICTKMGSCQATSFKTHFQLFPHSSRMLCLYHPLTEVRLLIQLVEF